MDKFRIIAITPEKPRLDEVGWIKALLDDSSNIVERIHLRHPGHDLRPLLLALPPDLRARISIHDQPELLNDFPEVGFHYNRRNKIKTVTGWGTRSASCHSWSEVMRCNHLNYVTLSPVFNSISKTDYPANDDLINYRSGTEVSVIALGGVSESNISRLTEFAGAAMLGTFDRPISELPKVLSDLKNNINNLCFNS